jgi:hypothetical protein
MYHSHAVSPNINYNETIMKFIQYNWTNLERSVFFAIELK